MRQDREIVEHPFGTKKARMGTAHILTEMLPKGGRRDGPLGAGLQLGKGYGHQRNEYQGV